MDSQALPVPHPHGAARRGEERPYARRTPEASDLYQIVQQELESFLAAASARERPVPRFVARELRAFLRCGILAGSTRSTRCAAVSAMRRLPRCPEDNRLLYRLKHRWRDGTTHVVFTPQELVEKLAALVPPPRFHLVRYHGVLGPCASERDRIVRRGRALG